MAGEQESFSHLLHISIRLPPFPTARLRPLGLDIRRQPTHTRARGGGGGCTVCGRICSLSASGLPALPALLLAPPLSCSSVHRHVASRIRRADIKDGYLRIFTDTLLDTLSDTFFRITRPPQDRTNGGLGEEGGGKGERRRERQGAGERAETRMPDLGNQTVKHRMRQRAVVRQGCDGIKGSALAPDS